MVLSALFDHYSVFLVDAYGVFWDGSGFIPGTVERLERLVAQGKTVLILSNTTQRAAIAAEKYRRHGLEEGRHYHAFITSGEVARRELEKGLVLEAGQLRRYYCIGTPNAALFAGLDYHNVSLDKAEFVYISVPQLTDKQKDTLTQHRYPFYMSASQIENEPLWDSTEIEAFSSLLAPVIARKLPVFSANPDTIAPEKCYLTQAIHPVIRQGTVAATLRAAGLSVREVGKPYAEIYAYAQALLTTQFGINKQARTAMIGDTLATDIRGAHQARRKLGWPVDAILTLTGNTSQNMLVGINSEDAPHHSITSFGMGGQVLT